MFASTEISSDIAAMHTSHLLLTRKRMVDHMNVTAHLAVSSFPKSMQSGFL